MRSVTQEASKQIFQFETNIKAIIAYISQQLGTALQDLTLIDGIVARSNDASYATILGELTRSLESSNLGTLISEDIKQQVNLIYTQIDDIAKILGKDRLGQIDISTLQGLADLQRGRMLRVQNVLINNLDNLVYHSIVGGAPITELVQAAQMEVEKFKNEMLTQIRTAKREFIQNVEDNIAEQIDFGIDENDIWEYTGAYIQDNSHDECIFALGQDPFNTGIPPKYGAPYFTNEEKIQFEAGGLFPHKEPRWNCQHYFAISNVTYAEAFPVSD